MFEAPRPHRDPSPQAEAPRTDMPPYEPPDLIEQGTLLDLTAAGTGGGGDPT